MQDVLLLILCQWDNCISCRW